MKAGNYFFILIMRVDGFSHNIAVPVKLKHDITRPINEINAYVAAGYQLGKATDLYNTPAFEYTDGVLIIPSDEPAKVCEANMQSLFDALDLMNLDVVIDDESIQEEVQNFLSFED